MCPACISAAAWLVFGGSSAGGVLVGIAAKLGGTATHETNAECKLAPASPEAARPPAENP